MKRASSYGVIHHLDLFSGIGGFALGAKLAGLAPTASYHSEIDPHARAIYHRNFPDSKPLGDIRHLDGRRLRQSAPPGARWLVTGGFPCQDLSDAGKKRGLDGPKSGLWREMLRVVEELRPHAVVFENVPTLRKKGLATVLRGLADSGFDAEWGVVSARTVGAPHLRTRLWIVAHPNGQRGGGVPTGELPGQAAGPGEQDVGENVRPDDPPDRSDFWAAWPGVWAGLQVHGEPLLRRVVHGLSARVDMARLTALGNAVVPQVAAVALRRAAPYLR